MHYDTLADLIVAGERITTTEDDPFWSVTDQQSERAGQLALGERLLTADGGIVVAAGLLPATAHRALAYHLTIHDTHTYYVGQTSILVHNTNTCGLVTPGKYFGTKTPADAVAALRAKFGPPKSIRPGADTFYNPITRRSYNVHTDPFMVHRMLIFAPGGPSGIGRFRFDTLETDIG